jgi:L-ascorbate metabolism protein UlaG (beta-lactamase superfamily)
VTRPGPVRPEGGLGRPVAGERLTWLGHSTVLIETGGTRVLTDPVLRGRIGHLVRDPPLPKLPSSLDAVLISHLHHDHLDIPTIRRLDLDAVLVVPRGAARMRAVGRMRREVRELDAGEVVELGGAAVRAVRAVHDGRRTPLSSRVDALGFVVEGRNSVYFAGDTELFEDMRHVADDLDVALLPVAGWGPRLGPGHMGPAEAAEAAQLLRPALAVPIHWGTLRRIGSRSADTAAPAAFAGHVARRAPAIRVEVLDPGESLALP